MNSSNKKNEDQILNKRASDPFDKLIFEQGLRIKQIITDKKLNTMVVLLNNGMVLKVPIDHFKRLNKANQNQLNAYDLIGGGIGIHWDELDEDLSLKSLIKDSALTSVLNTLSGKNNAGMLVL